MPRRNRDTYMHDVPSPSLSLGGDDTLLPDVAHVVNPGPIDKTLLYKQDTHRSKLIWETSNTDLLTVRHRGISWEADERILPYIVRAGFGPWYYMQNYEVDWSFMTALVERWRSETHTFHLRNGEMTITLEDVGVLTGLHIEGRAVTTDQEVDDYAPLCEQLLGVVPLHGKRDTTVRRTWFKNNMQTLPPEATEVEIQRYARAYILLMLGSSLLPDSSGSEISLHYLLLLADLDSLSSYSWGAAVLAYLYRSLCNACESKHKQLTGCAILLQLWAWEHLTIGRPMKLAIPAPPLGADDDPMRRPTLGYKWKVPKSYLRTSHQVLMLFRDLLDRQEANDVIWTPYDDEILATLNPSCISGRDSWRAEVPLICFNIAEMHYPSRVLRQFGCRQPVPASPPESHKEMHMYIRRTNLPADEELEGYIDIWNDRAQRIVIGEPHIDVSYLDAYYSWYLSVTRKRIQPPVDTPEPYRPSGPDHYVMVASLVRNCKAIAGLFFKTTEMDTKRVLHDMFHATHADLLKIGEDRALDIDVPSIHINKDSDDEVHLPQTRDDVGPSQVTQADSQRSPVRRASTRIRRTTQHYTPI
ncbi:hypothetical protein QQ045_002081 [Rhodiola kirilowii]